METAAAMGASSSDIEISDQRVAVDGGQSFVRIWNDRTLVRTLAPIVLVHDSLGCVELWRDFPADLCLRTGRTVLAYDRLGFGRSDPRSRRLSPDFIACEGAVGLLPILDDLGIGDWIGFGHSVGGGMTLHAAATVRGCLAAVTESAQAFLEQRTADGIRNAREDFALPGRLDRLKRYHGEKATWVLEAWTETWLGPAFADWSLDDVLPKVRVPVLAIHGDLDEYGSLAHPERIVGLAGGPAELAALPGVHHVPHREVAVLVLDLVADFISPLQ